MRLQGIEGLAVAVVKQAAHDYCEALKWVMKHGDASIDAEMLIDDLIIERAIYRQKQKWDMVRELNKKIDKYKRQADKQRELKEIETYFHSQAFHNISEIDGIWMMEKIKSNLEKDINFKIFLGDDF